MGFGGRQTGVRLNTIRTDIFWTGSRLGIDMKRYFFGGGGKGRIFFWTALTGVYRIVRLYFSAVAPDSIFCGAEFIFRPWILGEMGCGGSESGFCDSSHYFPTR
jgi:hypothetical protein